MANQNSELITVNRRNLIYAYINKLPSYRYLYKTNNGVSMCFLLNIIEPFPESNDEKEIIKNFSINLKYFRTFGFRLINRLVRISLFYTNDPTENVIAPSGAQIIICDPRSQFVIRDTISASFINGVLITKWK